MLAVESDTRQQALQLRRVAVARRVLVRRHAVDGSKQSFRRRHGYGTDTVARQAVDWHRKAIATQAAKTPMAW